MLQCIIRCLWLYIKLSVYFAPLLTTLTLVAVGSVRGFEALLRLLSLAICSSFIHIHLHNHLDHSPYKRKELIMIWYAYRFELYFCHSAAVLTCSSRCKSFLLVAAMQTCRFCMSEFWDDDPRCKRSFITQLQWIFDIFQIFFQSSASCSLRPDRKNILFPPHFSFPFLIQDMDTFDNFKPFLPPDSFLFPFLKCMSTCGRWLHRKKKNQIKNDFLSLSSRTLSGAAACCWVPVPLGSGGLSLRVRTTSQAAAQESWRSCWSSTPRPWHRTWSSPTSTLWRWLPQT